MVKIYANAVSHAVAEFKQKLKCMIHEQDDNMYQTDASVLCDRFLMGNKTSHITVKRLRTLMVLLYKQHQKN